MKTENLKVSKDVESFANVLKFFNKLLDDLGFKETEAEIYVMLLEKKKSMLISEIASELKISTRTARSHVTNLYKKGFLVRELFEKKWIGYKYKPIPPSEAWKKIKNKTEEFLKKLDEIIP